MIHGKRRDFERAVEDYTAAIAVDPADPDAFVNRAAIYRMMGDYEHALADYCAAIKLDPRPRLPAPKGAR